MIHILLKKAFNYKKRKKLDAPEGYYYDRIVGAWLSFQDKTLLITHAKFPAMGTKKEDIETGEDQKGQ